MHCVNGNALQLAHALYPINMESAAMLVTRQRPLVLRFINFANNDRPYCELHLEFSAIKVSLNLTTSIISTIYSIVDSN